MSQVQQCFLRKDEEIAELAYFLRTIHGLYMITHEGEFCDYCMKLGKHWSLPWSAVKWTCCGIVYYLSASIVKLFIPKFSLSLLVCLSTFSLADVRIHVSLIMCESLRISAYKNVLGSRMDSELRWQSRCLFWLLFTHFASPYNNSSIEHCISL